MEPRNVKVYRSDELIQAGTTLHIFSQTNETRHMPTHVHDFIEIIYITDGWGEEFINGNTYRVRHGDLLFINYGSTHAFVPGESFSFINICFKPEVLSESVITPENAFSVLQLTAFEEIQQESDEDGCVSFRGAERDEAETLLYAMQREYTEQKHSWKTVLKSYMNVLIALILRKLTSGDDVAEDGDIWEALSAYIDSNLEFDLTLQSLAGKCLYNPSYFSRAFKKKFNMSLTEYLNRKKIARAMELARQTNLSDEEICRRTGFSYKSSFYRVFQRISGMTFAEYKKSKTDQ